MRYKVQFNETATLTKPDLRLHKSEIILSLGIQLVTFVSCFFMTFQSNRLDIIMISDTQNQ